MNIDGDGELVLTFTGDVMLGQLVNEMLRHMGSFLCVGRYSTASEKIRCFSSGQTRMQSMFSKSRE